MKLCLNMIVKNEATRIERALASVAQFIDCYAITDTGSTDKTPEVIKSFFSAHKIPGHVQHAPFKDWSQARNAALIGARAMQPRFGWNYAILMDADMQLVIKDLSKFHKSLETDALAYDMEQRGGSLHYANKRLISAKATGFYKGVTHEYLDVASGGMIPAETAYFIDHADGANRPEKWKRDIRLLLEGLEKEPDNGRYYYYLAQSYRDARDFENAKIWYKKRVDFGGWEEERWSAQMNYAHTLLDLGDENAFIREMLVAYNMRPSRAESLHALAHHFRQDHMIQGVKVDAKQNVAALFAEVGMTIPRTNDLLFVSDAVYESGMKEEFAITGFYNEQKRMKAFKVCSDLSLQPGPYEGPRLTARQNIYHYIPKLGDACPSFVTKRIPFEPPENWIAMNPSVTNHGPDGRLWCVVRTVNYKIDEHGRYLIRGTDGTANDSNPINTRNYLLDMGFDPMTQTVPSAVEILAPLPPIPCEYKPVIGFEDMRLFSDGGALWTSSTVRQIHWDGNCEQVLAKISPIGGLTDWHRMLPPKRETEKNWAPIGPRPDDKSQFLWMHRPGVTINQKGEIVHSNPTGLTNDIISGGSQLIGSTIGYLALVHTAHQLPNSPCRYYYHRWAMYDPLTFKLVALSLPFVFEDRVIEFAAGLARHPTRKDLLVISYGYKDAEAKIATVSEAEVMRFIWSPK
jgi:glycosyltransferase involved in cell wall biosynthesis